MAPVEGSGDVTTRCLGTSEDNWMKATALGTGTAVHVAALRRILERGQVAQACGEVMEQHSLLRSQAVHNAKGKLTFAVKSGPVVPEVLELPWPSTNGIIPASGNIVVPGDDGLGAALNIVIVDEMNMPFVNSEKKTSPPLDLFQVHMYTESSRNLSIIVLRFHSGGLDKPSASIVMQQFLVALNSIVDGQTACFQDNAGKYAILPCIEDLVPKGKASKNIFQKGMDTVGYALSVNKYSLLPFEPTYSEKKKEPFKSDIVTYTLGKPGTADLLEKCKQENVTLAGALAAALLKAAANTKELKDKKKEDFSFTSLVDCRKYFEPNLAGNVTGNYVAGIPQAQAVKEGVSFWDLARSVSANTEKELSKHKQFSEIPVLNMLFAQVLKHPNVTPQSSMRTALFSLFVDEAPKMQWQESAQKLNLATVCGPFPSMHGVGPCFAVVESFIDDSDLSLSLIYPRPVYSRTQIEAVASSAMEHLNAAAKAL